MRVAASLLQGTITDLRALARQYAQLASLKAKESARVVTGGAIALAIAAGLAVVACGELLFALSVLLVDRAALPPARTAAAAGILTLLVAGALAAAGARLVGRADLDPRVRASRSVTDTPRGTPSGARRTDQGGA